MFGFQSRAPLAILTTPTMAPDLSMRHPPFGGFVHVPKDSFGASASYHGKASSLSLHGFIDGLLQRHRPTLRPRGRERSLVQEGTHGSDGLVIVGAV